MIYQAWSFLESQRFQIGRVFRGFSHRRDLLPVVKLDEFVDFLGFWKRELSFFRGIRGLLRSNTSLFDTRSQRRRRIIELASRSSG
jgi:hypothetical protein